MKTLKHFLEYGRFKLIGARELKGSIQGPSVNLSNLNSRSQESLLSIFPEFCAPAWDSIGNPVNF